MPRITIQGWLGSERQRTSFVIVSNPTVIRSHWIDSLNRSAKCIGTGCLLCASLPVKVEAVYIVEADRLLYLWALKPSEFELKDTLEPGHEVLNVDNGDGSRELRVIGAHAIQKVTATAYIAAIGAKVYNQAIQKMLR